MDLDLKVRMTKINATYFNTVENNWGEKGLKKSQFVSNFTSSLSSPFYEYSICGGPTSLVSSPQQPTFVPGRVCTCENENEYH